MSERMRSAIRARQGLGAHEPTQKRLRALLDGVVVADTTRGMLVWEPRRIVPSYAVPETDLAGALEPDPHPVPGDEGVPVLPPEVPFDVHTFPGERLLLRAPGGARAARAFRPDEDGLHGYVLLDFAGFDGWMEEDEPVISHPRDPFHRVDVLRGSRHVRVELGGTLLAETRRPRLLFETSLPMRAYIPREDVRTDLLEPTPTRTRCAYKGEASYWSVRGAGAAGADIAWSYPEPENDATAVGGLIAFFDERVDVWVDGAPAARPNTPWSPSWDGRMD